MENNWTQKGKRSRVGEFAKDNIDLRIGQWQSNELLNRMSYDGPLISLIRAKTRFASLKREFSSRPSIIRYLNDTRSRTKIEY